ncbi:hypothetical protein AB205_0202360 [Aquarana catesbeiana]|uniref:Uncharacterized protein n=1 Tax=Aquarana catesbeiana TaxID=8400 RepID=A0A2G9Q5Q6_AQUCT|nr:hypothetical protein AB205_0202360 [Aquarana catesbeiana]
MAESEQVADIYTNEEEEESPEPETSRSRRKRYKASNMSFGEMLEMVDIMKRADYDGKYGPYPNPNVRKANIMAKVVKSLHQNFGVRRSKDQLRKQWSDLKLREHKQYRKIQRVLQKREKRLGGHPSSEETRDPPPLEEGEIQPRQEEEEEEEVVEIGTTTGDRDVVDPDPFTSESAQFLIGEIMGCNRDLENIKKNINDVLQKNKNIIDVLGRV